MNSVLKEIKKLRGEKPITIDYSNSNRYRVVMKEENGTRTAYYFSTPIYNNKTKKVVDMKFRKKSGAIYLVGSNANITFTNHVRMENGDGFCKISLPKPISYIAEQELKCGNDQIYPTTNGLVYKAACKGENSFSFELEVDTPFLKTRFNNKYFSLMKEKFRPFVTVSCIGTADANGEIIAPAKIAYQQLNNRKYRLTVTPCSPMGKWVLFEANLYEAKLIQDTTVESANPTMNNAFGSFAFVGNTAQYGEQWLYSRLDFRKLLDISDKQILKATAHLPKYNRANIQLSAFKVAARFCSFGSNWNNKIATSNFIAGSSINDSYQDIDITSVLSDKTRQYRNSEGYILKPSVKGSGFSVVSTGDSYYAPQIYEINFR